MVPLIFRRLPADTDMLTVKKIKQAKPGPKPYDLADTGTGLFVRVYPTGTKTFRFRTKMAGRTVRMVFGRFGDDLTLAEARQKAAEARKLARSGINPAAAAQKAKHERQVMPTVEDFAAEYIQLYAKPNKRTWLEDEQMLASWVIPRIGKISLDDVHRRDLVGIVDAVEAAGHVRMPGKVLAVLRKMLRFAVERGVIEASPAVYITARQKKAVTRALTHDEIRCWWAGTFDSSAGTPSARLALRLLLLTGQRGSEVGGLRVSELDLNAKVWRLPGERRKMGHPHRVPLSDAAVGVIREALEICATGDLLFPNRNRTGGVRVDGGIWNALERIFKGADRIPGTHDARRTVATELSELGVSEEAIAAVLGHQPKTVTAAYVKRREQMARGPLEAWARHLAEVLGEEAGGNVVPICG